VRSISKYKNFVHKCIVPFLWISAIFICFISLESCKNTNEADPNVPIRYFHAHYQYPTGGNSHYLTHGDFNRDGAIDLAITTYNTNHVAVLLRDSEKGNFKLHVDYPVGKGPGMIVCGQLDGDGFEDLVVLNQDGDSFSTLYGKGDGTFEDPIEFGLTNGAKSSAIALTDANKDGLTDVIIAEYGTGIILLIQNAGARTWGNVDIIHYGSGPRWLLPIDLDKNGEVDLIISNRDSNNISVLLSQPGALFSQKNDYPVGVYPRSIDTCDINGDSYPDLVVANAGSGTYSVLLNDTKGVMTVLSTIQSRKLPTKALLRDINKDGFVDLIGLLYGELTLSTGTIANGPFASAEIFYGTQERTFEYLKTINLGVGAVDIDTADLNADTHEDLMFTLFGLDRVGIIYGDSQFFNKAEERPEFSGDIGTLATANLDSDAEKEIVIASNRAPYFRIFKFDSNQKLVEKGKWDLPSIIQNINLTSIDNGNNSIDMILCLKGQEYVVVYLNNGEGLLQKKGEFSVRAPSINHQTFPSSVAVGDVNNDGNNDLVTANPQADTVSVLLGDGNGSFGPANETVVGDYPMAVKLADVNKDGILDLLFVSSRDPNDPNDTAPSRFVCWLGKGDGTFDKSTQKRYATDGNPRGLLLYDLDKDGDSEAVTVHPGGGSFVVFGAKDNGSFVRVKTIRIGKTSKSLFTWDINNDSFSDLISTNGESIISIILNQGGLDFSSEYYYYVGHSPVSAIPYDIDKDGILDIIIANNASNDLSFVYGRQP